MARPRGIRIRMAIRTPSRTRERMSRVSKKINIIVKLIIVNISIISRKIQSYAGTDPAYLPLLVFRNRFSWRAGKNGGGWGRARGGGGGGGGGGRGAGPT